MFGVAVFRFSLYSKEGNPKEGKQIMVDIGGPMCFQVSQVSSFVRRNQLRFNIFIRKDIMNKVGKINSRRLDIFVRLFLRVI